MPTADQDTSRQAGDSARRLATRVARAASRPGAQRTLLLDLDGTLAPIAPTPGEARVPTATLEAVRALVRRGWRVAIVSGRPAREVRAMVPVRGIKVFGSHGLEGSWSGRPSRALDPALKARLERLAVDAERLASGVPGVLVERKPAGVAIHDRRVRRGHRARWNRRLRCWLDEQDLEGLELLDGRRVVELRPAGVHKGRAVRSLPLEPGAPAPDSSLVAMGDDRTDEDMFRALRGRGLSVRVGRRGKRSVARVRLASPAAVCRFLRQLAGAGYSSAARTAS